MDSGLQKKKNPENNIAVVTVLGVQAVLTI